MMRRHAVVAVAVAALAIGGGGTGAWLARSGPSVGRLMDLQPLSGRAAPDFVLTDQFGQKRSLASFRGKAVVLDFMDPRCTDVCPLVARELIGADHRLGGLASRAVFVGVDANPRYRSLYWLRRFSSEQGLDHLANWYFFTGSLAQLRQVWADYGITVELVPSTGAVTHTTVMDFIGPDGRERELAAPWSYLRPDGTGYLPPQDITMWGRGIATELERLAAPAHG